MLQSGKFSSEHLHKHACLLPLVIAIFCITNLFNLPILQAQGAQTVQSSQGKLKKFEGFYRFQNEKDVYLQISSKENQLVLKQLWDGKEIVFEQNSALDFYCKEQSFPLKFKDSAGSIIQVLAFNRDVWDRVKNYKPLEIKEVQLTPQQLKPLEGKYQMKHDDEDVFLQVRTAGNKLFLKQLWDGQELVFVPQSPLDFFCKERMFPLKFSKGGDGNITQVLAFNKDVWLKVKE